MTTTEVRGRPRRGPRLVLGMLDSPMGWMFGGLCELRYVGARTGRVIRLPVGCVRSDHRVVVLVGDAGHKTWWRNFVVPRPVDVVVRGVVHSGTGRLVATTSDEWSVAKAAYARRYPRRDVGSDPFVVIDLDDGRVAGAEGRALRSAWFRWVTVGEATGFLVPALTAAAVGGSRPSLAVPALVAAGVAEGTLLGAAQAHVLRRALPHLPARRWVLATALAAGVAWVLGLLPSWLGDTVPSVPSGVVVVVGVVAGFLLLLTIGTAQALVLRGRVRRPERWITATAFGWLAGLTVFMVFATPLWRPGQPVWLTGLIGDAGGLLMAATVAAVTGRALVRLLRG